MVYLIVGVGVVAIVLVFQLFIVITKRLNHLTTAEVADIIERHISGTEEPWDWAHFTSVPIRDDGLDNIRIRCLELENALSQESIEELRRTVEHLRSKAS